MFKTTRLEVLKMTMSCRLLRLEPLYRYRHSTRGIFLQLSILRADLSRRRRQAHVIRRTGGVVYTDSGSTGMDTVEPCASAPEGDKSGSPVADATKAAVADASGVRRLGKLSMSRGAGVGAMKSLTNSVGALRKVDQIAVADGTVGSVGVPSECSAFQAARLPGKCLAKSVAELPQVPRAPTVVVSEAEGPTCVVYDRPELSMVGSELLPSSEDKLRLGH